MPEPLEMTEDERWEDLRRELEAEAERNLWDGPEGLQARRQTRSVASMEAERT